MRYLLWLVRFLLLALLVTFAVKNTETVTVRYFLGYEWQAPLVFVLLVFFCIGAVLGVMAGLARYIRQRRELAALKRELRSRPRSGEEAASKGSSKVA